MIDLDLLSYADQLSFKTAKGKRYIFDPLRKKWLVSQPEETVRQLLIQFLLIEKGYRKSHIVVERLIKFNKMTRRCDILVFDLAQQPFLLVECKAPYIAFSKDAYWQSSWYNLGIWENESTWHHLPLKVKYHLITNGEQTYCASIDYENRDFTFLDTVPEFPV